MIMKKRWKHIIDFLHDYINKARTKTWTNNSCSTSLPHQSRSKRRVKNHSLYIQRSTTDPLHSLTEPYIMFSHCGHGIPCHNTTSWAVLPTEHRPTDNRNDDDHESTTDDTVNTGVHYCLVGPINHLTNREEFVITSSTVIQRYSFTSISRLSTRVRFIAAGTESRNMMRLYFRNYLYRGRKMRYVGYTVHDLCRAVQGNFHIPNQDHGSGGTKNVLDLITFD